MKIQTNAMFWIGNNALGWLQILRFGSDWNDVFWYLIVPSVCPAPSSCRPMEPSVPTEPLSWSSSRHFSCWSSTWDNTSWGPGGAAAVAASRTPLTWPVFTMVEFMVEFMVVYKVEVEGGGAAVVPVSLTRSFSVWVGFHPSLLIQVSQNEAGDNIWLFDLEIPRREFCQPTPLKIRIFFTRWDRDSATGMSR